MLIIKDLWIITKGGICLFHYHASYSEYELDESLFSGFIAALAAFTTSLASSHIDFLKMSGDEMYFTVLDELIVVSIMTTGGEQHVITQMLEFIGGKFADNYSEHFTKHTFDWVSIAHEFTEEIEFLWADDEIYEETKREMINELFTQVTQERLSPENFYFKTMMLFLNSPAEVIESVINLIKNLETITLPTIPLDVKIKAKITASFKKIVNEMNTILYNKLQTRRVLVICEDYELFQALSDKLMAYGTLAMLFLTCYDLDITMKYWTYDQIPSSVLLIQPSISIEEVQILERLKLEPESKVYLWLREITPEVKEIVDNKSNFVYIPQIPSLDNMILMIREIELGRKKNEGSQAELKRAKILRFD
ncbi:MAG: hypothetical protein ACFFCQ_04985 [Promethearchaeota archaeon]